MFKGYSNANPLDSLKQMKKREYTKQRQPSKLEKRFGFDGVPLVWVQ